LNEQGLIVITDPGSIRGDVCARNVAPWALQIEASCECHRLWPFVADDGSVASFTGGGRNQVFSPLYRVFAIRVGDWPCKGLGRITDQVFDRKDQLGLRQWIAYRR